MGERLGRQSNLSDQDLTSRAPDRTALAESVAVVTGASSGIGRAIAIELAQRGARLCAIGRNPAALAETIAASKLSPKALPYATDLTGDESIQQLARWLEQEFGRVDVLVHSAGVIHHDPVETARAENFDLQYAANLRAPYLLTQALLQPLTISRGQIVFINSSLGLNAKRPAVGQFAATQHALKAVADSLREEVNPRGIRVLTVHTGRTATPRQQRLHQEEHRVYRPQLLLQPEDVASIVVHSLALPRTAEVTDISIRQMIKS
jgi:NAD(P)-dependent dehydrogenase (short-subunit alcohol dehydrogenase family)